MRLVLLIALLLADLANPGIAVAGSCVPPDLRILGKARSCTLLSKTCVVDNALVVYGQHSDRQQIPAPESVPWNFPAITTSPDAFRGDGAPYAPFLRRASSLLEPEELHDPVYSRCTAPVVMYSSWPYNWGEFFAEVLSMVHRATEGHGIGMNLTLVMALPQSLALARFQRLLLAPYTKFGVTTLAEVGRLDHLGRPVDWSHEGRHVNCFKQMALCRWEGGRSHRGAPVAAVGARVVGWLTDPTRGGPLPPDPLGFGGWRRVPGYEDSPAPRPPLTGAKPRRGSKQQLSEAARRSLEAELRAAEELAAAREPEPPGPPKLRVLIERRSGMTRILRNLEELLRACEEADEAGFAHGPFRGIACRAHGFASAGQRGSGGTDAAALRANAAAVRSAHVLFALHGAGQTNAFFMGQHSAGPSALVDVRPCGLGTGVASWPDSYAPALHQRSGDAVRVFALNVEHPAQCLPPDYVVAVRNGTLDARYVTSNPASQLRDQHVALRADQFLQVLAHAASLMANRTAFQGALDAGRLHAYALPDEDGGLQFGPLGLENPKRFFWARANNVTLPEDGSGGAGWNKGGDQFIGWELAAFAAGFKGGRR